MFLYLSEKTFTKESLIAELKAIRGRGWVPNMRRGNAGGIGNTLEDLLGIEENNLPTPDASKWELKTQRKTSTSLLTLFHMEPSPRTFSIVSRMLLPKYGWPHKSAGTRYPANEKSFRQTIGTLAFSDRGFRVFVNREKHKIFVRFDAAKGNKDNAEWLKTVEQRIGLKDLDPNPYWNFEDLFAKIRTKLHNCFYVRANTKRMDGREFYKYEEIWALEQLSIDKFVGAIERGKMLIDFDARTGHNHGTKFRLRQHLLPMLYEKSQRY